MIARDVVHDVCLSFAGEDRHFVRQVAHHLGGMGVRHFYDFDPLVRVELWGKDLHSELDLVYRKRALCCVVFVSRHYAASRWSLHELRSARAREFQEIDEYVLPVRFDDTEIDGVLPTTGFFDLRQDVSPLLLATYIRCKVELLRARHEREAATSAT